MTKINDDNTLYIPTTLTSYFIEQLKRLPAVGIFECFNERPDTVAYKVYGDVNLAWVIKAYNNITHPYDGSFSPGKVLRFPSLNSIEKLYATLTSKQRASEAE